MRAVEDNAALATGKPDATSLFIPLILLTMVPAPPHLAMFSSDVLSPNKKSIINELKAAFFHTHYICDNVNDASHLFGDRVPSQNFL
jgi:hypothetical protein